MSSLKVTLKSRKSIFNTPQSFANIRKLIKVKGSNQKNLKLIKAFILYKNSIK